MFVKICGLTDQESVAAALDAGADAIGFVFAPSVRQISPTEAARLAAPARGRALCVAVTRHPVNAELEEIFEIFSPDWLQTDHADISSLSARTLEPLRRSRLLPVYRESEVLAAELPARLLFEGAVRALAVPRTGRWQERRQNVRKSCWPGDSIPTMSPRPSVTYGLGASMCRAGSSRHPERNQFKEFTSS